MWLAIEGSAFLGYKYETLSFPIDIVAYVTTKIANFGTNTNPIPYLENGLSFLLDSKNLKLKQASTASKNKRPNNTLHKHLCSKRDTDRHPHMSISTLQQGNKRLKKFFGSKHIFQNFSSLLYLPFSPDKSLDNRLPHYFSRARKIYTQQIWQRNAQERARI